MFHLQKSCCVVWNRSVFVVSLQLFVFVSCCLSVHHWNATSLALGSRTSSQHCVSQINSSSAILLTLSLTEQNLMPCYLLGYMYTVTALIVGLSICVAPRFWEWRWGQMASLRKNVLPTFLGLRPWRPQTIETITANLVKFIQRS